MQIANIRKAVPSDAEAMLELVKELALFEKAPEAVKTQVSDYSDGLSSGLFQALVLEIDGRGVVGMALFFPYFSTWGGKTLYLEDFIVQEALRGNGYGRMLFEAFLEEAKQQGAKKVKWQVLDWNEPARQFYKKYGAALIPGWENGVIEFEQG
ncbi:MAG: GNAT family N-acetyltransferase [Saprospiraceae bacterium]|nr:GNAT family N-acetyltransferase [Saprospiraceae bacterium]